MDTPIPHSYWLRVALCGEGSANSLAPLAGPECRQSGSGGQRKGYRCCQLEVCQVSIAPGKARRDPGRVPTALAMKSEYR